MSELDANKYEIRYRHGVCIFYGAFVLYSIVFLICIGYLYRFGCLILDNIR